MGFKYLFTRLQRHEFQVEMSCGGCSGAVTRVLNKKGKKNYVYFMEIPMLIIKLM